MTKVRPDCGTIETTSAQLSPTTLIVFEAHSNVWYNGRVVATRN